MGEVFISYSRATRPAAGLIAEALSLEGYPIWWDEEIPVHRSYTAVIEEKIADATAVVVAWSEAAIKSDWVRAEAEKGRSQGKLVQVLVDDAELPLPFSQLQYADLRGWNGDRHDPEWQKVIASLAAIASRPVPPAPAEAREIRHRFHRAGLSMPLAGAVALGLGVILLCLMVGVLWVGHYSAATVAPPALTAAPAAVAPVQKTGGYILAQSGRRRLVPDDIFALSKSQLRLARNEIYARHGYVFQSPDLRDYFAAKTWYHPAAGAIKLSDTEAANVLFLQSVEAQR